MCKNNFALNKHLWLIFHIQLGTCFLLFCSHFRGYTIQWVACRNRCLKFLHLEMRYNFVKLLSPNYKISHWILNVGCGSLCAAYWGVGLNWTAGCLGGVAHFSFYMWNVLSFHFYSPTLLHTSVRSLVYWRNWESCVGWMDVLIKCLWMTSRIFLTVMRNG